MPINPLIILQGRGPNVDTPAEMIGKGLTLKNLSTTNDVNNERLKQMRMETAAGEQAVRDDQAARDIYSKNTTIGANGLPTLDKDATLAGLYKAGNIKGGDALAAQMRAQRTADLTNLKTQGEVLKEHNAAIGRAAGSVLNAPLEMQAGVYAAARAQLIGQGLLKAEEIPEQFDAAWVQQHYQNSIDADKQLAEHSKELDRALKEAEQAETARKNLTVEDETHRSNVVKEQQEATKITQTATRDANTAKYQTAQVAVGHERNAVARANGAANVNPFGSASNNLTGEEFLQTLPMGLRNQVKQVAEGKILPQNLPRTKDTGVLMRAVSQYDPTYSIQRGQLRAAFTTGPDGRNIGNLNTAVDHLSQLGEAAEALKNGSFQPGNKAYNYLAEKFGGENVTNQRFVMHALAGEVASALKGNATDQEIASILSTLSPDMSPAQMLGIINTGLHILGAKLNTYDQRYHDPNTGAPDDPWSPVLPTAREIFKRHNISPTKRDAPASSPTLQSGGKRPPLSSFEVK